MDLFAFKREGTKYKTIKTTSKSQRRCMRGAAKWIEQRATSFKGAYFLILCHELSILNLLS